MEDLNVNNLKQKMMSLLKSTEIKYTPWPAGFISEFYQLCKEEKRI